MDIPQTEPTVTITASRLAELEAAAQQLTHITQAKQEKLHALRTSYDTKEKVIKRVHKYLDNNRDTINARRRELRRLKKEAAAQVPGFTGSA